MKLAALLALALTIPAPAAAEVTLRWLGVAGDLVRTLRPRLVVPHHFDDFFCALDEPDAGAPSDPDDLAAFEVELRGVGDAAGVDLGVRTLGLFETLTLSARN
ncbi:MAG: hypothetical protein OEM05_10130 [Myxococcales bacterium]|nr:hypothetical protein [Myxococcales bacterium]